MFKKKKPRARFFSLHPAVHTLHPITKAAELDRKWVKDERGDYRDRLSTVSYTHLTLPTNREV